MRLQFRFHRFRVVSQALRLDALEAGRAMAIERSAAKLRRAKIVEHRDLLIVRVVKVRQPLQNLQLRLWRRHQREGGEFFHHAAGAQAEARTDQVAEESRTAKV